MKVIWQRVGIYVKQKTKGRGYKTRFFFIDNEYNIIFSPNYAYIEKMIKSSDTVGDIVNRISSNKKINFKDAKIGSLKFFSTIESIPVANKNCFEMFIDKPNPMTLIIFAI